MMDGFWSTAKDAAAFLGSLCLFVPWAMDFSGRVRLENLKKVSSRLELLKRLRERRETWLARPKRRDLLISLTGMVLISASFGISLLISLKLLPE
jgi:hypothetical protein